MSKKRTGTINLKDFHIRRAFRILPLYSIAQARIGVRPTPRTAF